MPGRGLAEHLDDRVGVEEHDHDHVGAAHGLRRVVGHGRAVVGQRLRPGRAMRFQTRTLWPCWTQLPRHAGAHLPGPEDRHRRHGRDR